MVYEHDPLIDHADLLEEDDVDAEAMVERIHEVLADEFDVDPGSMLVASERDGIKVWLEAGQWEDE